MFRVGRGQTEVRLDGMDVDLFSRGMTEAARQYAKDGKEWRALVHM